MIARVWHGITQSERADEYVDYLRQTGVNDLHNTPGNQGVLVIRKIDGNEAFFTLISFWDSIQSIKKFAGEDVEKARYYPEDHEFLKKLDPKVEHFEVMVNTVRGSDR